MSVVQATGTLRRTLSMRASQQLYSGSSIQTMSHSETHSTSLVSALQCEPVPGELALCTDRPRYDTVPDSINVATVLTISSISSARMECAPLTRSRCFCNWLSKSEGSTICSNVDSVSRSRKRCASTISDEISIPTIASCLNVTGVCSLDTMGIGVCLRPSTSSTFFSGVSRNNSTGRGSLFRSVMTVSRERNCTPPSRRDPLGNDRD